MKRFVLNFSLVLFSTVGTLLFLEVTVRIIEVFSVSANHATDRVEHELIPARCGKAHDICHERNKPPGTFRIAAIGDSFTYGDNMYADDVYPKRLERIINANTHVKKVEILNMGVPGYSTESEYALVDMAIKSYDVDLIILQITLNDADPVPYQSSHKEEIEEWQHIKQSFLYRNSKLAAFIIEHLHVLTSRKNYLTYFNGLYEDDSTWVPFSAAITRIVERTKVDRIPLHAVIFPLFSYTVDKEYPFGIAHKKIMKDLKSKGVKALDLKKFYKDIPHERLEAIPGRDAHPNEIAHRIAADAIYGWLKKDNYLSKLINVSRSHS